MVSLTTITNWLSNQKKQKEIDNREREKAKNLVTHVVNTTIGSQLK